MSNIHVFEKSGRGHLSYKITQLDTYVTCGSKNIMTAPIVRKLREYYFFELFRLYFYKTTLYMKLHWKEDAIQTSSIKP